LSGSVKLLCQIQNIDLEIDSIEKEKERYQKDLEGLSVGINSLSEQIEALKKELAVFKAEKSERDDKVRENKEKIEKDQKRLNEIKTEKQLAALTKEITNAQKANKLLDIEIGSLSEKEEAREKVLLEKDGSLNEKTEKSGALKEEFERRKAEWKAQREEKEKMRIDVSSKLPPHLLKKYETIRSRRAGIGIVNVKNETCRGCYIQIPPQVYIQLKKGSEEIITCPHCHRILYSEESPGAKV